LDAFERWNPILSEATDYEQFFHTDKPFYPVIDYEFGYEVYAIFKKDIDIWSDERCVVSSNHL
jgi:hypothetical protein